MISNTPRHVLLLLHIYSYLPYSQCTGALTIPDRRPRNLIAIKIIINIDFIPRITRRKRPRYADKRIGWWISAAATGDLQLSTGNIELGVSAWIVDAELLDAEEVVGGWEAFGDLYLKSFCLFVSQ